MVEQRCRELGIPPEFSPRINCQWYGRGQNAVSERRAELRVLAKTRLVAMKAEAKSKIERMSLEAQTEVIRAGLETEAAKAFLN